MNVHSYICIILCNHCLFAFIDFIDYSYLLMLAYIIARHCVTQSHTRAVDGKLWLNCLSILIVSLDEGRLHSQQFAVSHILF